MATSDLPVAASAVGGEGQPSAAASAELSLDDLSRKQKELLQCIEGFSRDKNLSADQLARLAKEAQQKGQELQTLADRYAAQEQAKGVPSAGGRTQVALTPLQRWWIYSQTGIDMEVLVLDDMTGKVAASMPLNNPYAIGQLALAEAQRRQAQAKAEAEAQKLMREALEQIETKGSVELREQVNRLKRDPNFLGGALSK
ncbi:MAG TPA: hypothetical protein PKI03_38725 [Pseudomonadota bacterium]|nr:hypothetical protein [Pseudomonadota bacterium]